MNVTSRPGRVCLPGLKAGAPPRNRSVIKVLSAWGRTSIAWLLALWLSLLPAVRPVLAADPPRAGAENTAQSVGGDEDGRPRPSASSPHSGRDHDDDSFISQETKRKASEFADKWLVNGSAIGNAIGAVAGQLLFGMFVPGPIGMALGATVGSLIGGYIGAAIDDRVGIAVNYVAFDRPPLTKGGLWLEGVGPWEQFFYQIDAWVISGGALAGIANHFFMNMLARTIPGLGVLANPIILALTDYTAGLVGDNVDGLIDLGKIGRKIDEKKGTVPVAGPAGGDASSGTDGGDSGVHDGASSGSSSPAEARFELRDAYEEIIDQLKHGGRDSVKQLYEGFRNLSEAARDVTEQNGRTH